MFVLIKIIQESTLPKLSETGLYQTSDETSKITECVKWELQHLKEIKPDEIKDPLALIRFNGDSIVRAATDAYMNGKIVISYNKEDSRALQLLPYLVVMDKKSGRVKKVVIFANTFMDNLTSDAQYTRLGAVMEAAYLAYKLAEDQNKFVMNDLLMMNLCSVYTVMACLPLQPLKFSGDNMMKATLYVISYFYKMFRGANISESNIPFKRLVPNTNNLDPEVIKQIVQDVKDNAGNSFMGLIELIKKINPVSYKAIDTRYMLEFIGKCGNYVPFSLENISYLFLVLTSATYSTTTVGNALRALIKPNTKPILQMMSTIIS